jgi:hypothetical protein
MRPIPDELFDRTQAHAAGWSDSALRRAVNSGRLVRLRHGLYCDSTQAGRPALDAIAAVRACTGSVVSHRSAALLHELPLIGHARDSRPSLTVQPGRTGDVRDALLHRASLWPEDVTILYDVPVTSVARTLVDLGRSRSTATTVAAADAALHRGLVEQAAIDDVLLHCWVWPGIRRAHRSLARVDARSESPLESVSRLVLAWAGLPVPELQADLQDADGSFLGRPDFYWPEFGVVGEADGRMKYTDRDVLFAEKRRQEAFEVAGLIVVRWSWADVTRRPRWLCARLENAFERGRQRDRSGFPRNWSVRAA